MAAPLRPWALAATLLVCACTRDNPNYAALGVQTARCGDGLCSSSEDCGSCPVDCGSCLGCRPGFADCDHSGINGCETNITTPQTCGGCNNPCLARGGTNACLPDGDHFVCHPTCDLTHVDCDGDPSNGCEASFTADPGDAPEACPGSHLAAVNEGSSESFGFGRILPAGDVDVYNVLLQEGTTPCSPTGMQQFHAKITLDDSSNSGAALGLGADVTSCTGTWPNQGASFCIDWVGSCAVNDSRTIYFEVRGGTPSCKNYTVTIDYCNEGTACPGC